MPRKEEKFSGGGYFGMLFAIPWGTPVGNLRDGELVWLLYPSLVCSLADYCSIPSIQYVVAIGLSHFPSVVTPETGRRIKGRQHAAAPNIQKCHEWLRLVSSHRSQTFPGLITLFSGYRRVGNNTAPTLCSPLRMLRGTYLALSRQDRRPHECPGGGGRSSGRRLQG